MKASTTPSRISLPFVVAVLVGLAASRYWQNPPRHPSNPSSETVMLLPIDGPDARSLYLVPGGAYTQSDIAANGGTTAAQRYRGFRAVHDTNPLLGDKICPITLTKANPQCTWIVGGRIYQFCCPPCIDEFVRLAKERPEDITMPHTYIKDRD